jgi:glycosyltransferase involved in cell wall biosynthesis
MNAIVLIPAYCPEPVLPDLVERLLSFDFRVVVIDDGSGDRYRDIFMKLEKMCVVLHHETNRGKGEAIKTGFRYAEQEAEDSSLVGIMDADGQHTPEDMARVLLAANQNPQFFVLGCRDIDAMPFRSRIGNRLTSAVFSRLYKTKISDTQTGMRAFSRDLLPVLLDVEGSRYEYEMNVLTVIAQKRIPVVEVPIHTIYRDAGNSTSHFHVIRDSFLIYKKLLFFTLSSLSGFVIDYVLFTVLMLIFPHGSFSLIMANVMARLVSGYCNYSLNCKVVFRKKRDLSTALKYLFLAVSILIMNNAVLLGYAQVLHIPVYPAKLLTELTLFAVSWAVQSTFIFRENSVRGWGSKEA